MITKTQLISDIELELFQGAPSDDSELEQSQIAFWIQIYLNDLIRREILDFQKKGQMIPPIYIRRDVELVLQEEVVADVEDFNQRIYVDLEDLTEEILDLPRDSGLVRVLDYDRNKIDKTSVEDLEDLRNLRFAKPSSNNILYYREGSKLFIEGFNTADIEFNPIMVHYVPKQNILSLADSGEILITDQLLPMLIDMCVEKGKAQLYGTQSDEQNDGRQDAKPVYHQQINNPIKDASTLNSEQQ